MCRAGLDWLMLNHVAPAVATMSLGVPVGQWSRALDSAVTSLIDQAKAGAPRPGASSRLAACMTSKSAASQYAAGVLPVCNCRSSSWPLLFTTWALAALGALE